MADTEKMDIETFRANVAKARAKNPTCVYCRRDLSAVENRDVMYMLGSRRIACRDCPEAIVVGDPDLN